MSIEKEVEIYSYTLNVLNLTLKVKFPCKIHLEHAGTPITTEVAPASPHKFIFNQEVTLKNQTEKDYIEVLVQLVTDKGAKYVGGVLKFQEKELIGSEGQCIVVPLAKCLDNEASCEVRVEQVSTSRVVKKESGRKKTHMRTEFNPDINISSPFIGGKTKLKEGETKSQFNMPLSMAYKKDQYNIKVNQPTVGGPVMMRKRVDISFDKDPALSAVGGMSAIEMEVYKEGYNKLKEKYRKQAENARSELNKRMALETIENNLKLQVMRYKLKTEELEKSLLEKTQKLKELSESLSQFQKKELDIKYMKEQLQNKNYTIRNLQQTIKTITKDNTELKNLQNLKSANQQESIKQLKEDIERLKKESQLKQIQLTRELKSKIDTINKREYELQQKSEEAERAKCSIQDLEKTISNKMFEWEKVQQHERSQHKVKTDQLKQRINKLKEEKASQQQAIKSLEENIEQLKNTQLKVQYDKKVINQNFQTLAKQAQQLKAIKQKYIQLVRTHKLVSDQKGQIQKTKQKQGKQKQSQLDELSQKYNQLNESTRKAIKDLQDKLKVNQLKLIELENQNELLKNQLDKAKRQNDSGNKDNNELKNQLRDSKNDCKEKEEKLLALTNELAEMKNKYKQAQYAGKLELERLKGDLDKTIKSLDESSSNNVVLAEQVSKLELENNKLKMQAQFKEQKAAKEINYAKEKHNNLQSFKGDLQVQINANSQQIAALKLNEKALNEKIQKLQLEAIKSKETLERMKKDQKVTEQKLSNTDNNLKNKQKQLLDQLAIKEGLDKDLAAKEAEISQLKNELNKEINQKNRNLKITEILQGDLTKAKEEQNRLNGVIKQREKTEEELRDELKKQKEQYTKLDMKLAALKKEYEKFKQTLTDNINTTFASIPDGSLAPATRQSKIINTEKTNLSENAEILNLLINLGKDARSNMNKMIDNMKAAQRERQTLNSEFSTSVNKASTNQFELNQNINRLEEELSELMAEKQNNENKYEEEIFLLEGRVREKQSIIAELTQQIEELDFSFKNTKTELEAVREQNSRKDATKTKLINQLRQQIEYHLGSISILESNQDKLEEELHHTTLTLEQTIEKNNKLEKELAQTKETLHDSEQQVFSLKRDLKKANELIDDLNLQLSTSKGQNQKLRAQVEDEERKSGEMRQFVNTLMKQKEQIIKKELEKSEQLLENDTKYEELKHENEWLSEELKKVKKSEEELKQSLKKTVKSLKEEQQFKNEEKSKNLKLSQKLKEKEKQSTLKEENILRLEQKLKKEKEKSGKDLKQIQNELDQTYAKLLTKQKENNEKIISLENENQRFKSQIEKLKQEVLVYEETIFNQKSKYQTLSSTLQTTEKALNQANQHNRQMEEKMGEFEEDLHNKEEEAYKLQAKIFGLESKLEQKELQKNDKMDNLHEDWLSKYESMAEEYEQRMELVEKQKFFLKERLEEKERETKKLSNQNKLQQNNISILKKNYEQKIKSLEEDRLAVLSQKNTENQRLIDQNRVHFQNLKTKQSEFRKINSQLELSKTTVGKLQIRLKETEEKIKNLNRMYQLEVEEFKKKEQSFKKIKENASSSIWKSEREVRKVIQQNIKKILEVVDQQSTVKVVQITKNLQQLVVGAISIKLEEKEGEKQ